MKDIRRGSSWRKRAAARIVARDGSICRACGANEQFTWMKGGIYVTSFEEGHRYQVVHRVSILELDHIVPLHKGGTNDDGNLQLLCQNCHKAKSAVERSTRCGRDVMGIVAS